MPGEGSATKVYIGNRMVDYIPSNGVPVLAVETAAGVKSAVINADGSFPALTIDGALDVPGAFTAEVTSTFEGDITLDDGVDIILDTTTGTKIGTATTQKLGFYNATPTVRPVVTTVDAGHILAALVALGLVEDGSGG